MGFRMRGLFARVARQLTLGIVLVSALSGLTSLARAEPSPGDREASRSMMREGERRFEDKDYEGALRAYEGAHAIMNVPTTGYAVAKARAALGKLMEARDAAVLVVRMPKRGDESVPFTNARADAEKLAAELESRIPSLEIRIEGPPSSEAVVDLDGARVAPALLNLPRKVNPGKHVIQASAPGLGPTRREVTLTEGQTEVVKLVLTASGESAASGTATADRTAGAEPATASAQESGHRLSPLVYVGFGAGAAGVVVGSIFGVMHLSKVSSIKDDYCGGGTACRPGFEAAVDDARPSAMIANIGFAVGAVGIGVGIAGLITGGGSAAPQKTGSIVPTIGIGSVGAVASF